MTTPKTAQITCFYCHCDTEAYLLQESAPLVEALKSIGNIIGGPTMGYAPDHIQLIEREKMFNKSYEILSKSIEAFQKKHGGVV